MFAYFLSSHAVCFVFCRRFDQPINRYRTYKHKIRTLPGFCDKQYIADFSLSFYWPFKKPMATDSYRVFIATARCSSVGRLTDRNRGCSENWIDDKNKFLISTPCRRVYRIYTKLMERRSWTLSKRSINLSFNFPELFCHVRNICIIAGLLVSPGRERIFYCLVHVGDLMRVTSYRLLIRNIFAGNAIINCVKKEACIVNAF